MNIHEYFIEQGSYLLSPDEWAECGTRQNEAGEIVKMRLAPADLVAVPEPIEKASQSDGEALFDRVTVTVNLPEIKAAQNHNRYAVARHIGSDGETYYPATDGDGGAYWLWVI